MKMQSKNLLLLLIFFVNIVFAQIHQGKPREMKNERGRGERRKQIEELKIWKMTNYLDLSSEQSEKLFPKLKNHEKKMFKIIKEQHRYMEDLSKKCESEKYDPDEKEIIQIIEKIEKTDLEIKRMRKEFVLTELNFLTNKQKVKYIVFDSRFKSHLLKALREHNKRK